MSEKAPNGIASVVRNLIAGVAIVSTLASSGCYVEKGYAYFQTRPLRNSKQGIPQNSGKKVTVVHSYADRNYAKRYFQDSQGHVVVECEPETIDKSDCDYIVESHR